MFEKYDISREDVEVLDKCPTCHGISISELSSVTVQGSGFKFFATACCHTCGFVFRSRRPRLDWFVEVWGKREKDPQKVTSLSKDEETEKLRYYRYKNLSSVLAEYSDNKSLIDIGCGPGTGLTAFVDEGWDVTGIEPDPVRANEGIENHGLNIITSTIEDYEPAEKYDIATLVHVLEHFHSPVELLKKTADCVKDGGYIYVEVPHLFRFVDLRDSLYLEHMNNFNEKTLAYAGHMCGLAVQEIFVTKTNPEGVNHLAMLFRKSDKRRAGDLATITNAGFPSISLAQYCDSSSVDKWAAELKSGSLISDKYYGKLRYMYRSQVKPDDTGHYSEPIHEFFMKLLDTAPSLNYIVPHIDNINNTLSELGGDGLKLTTIGDKILVTIER